MDKGVGRVVIAANVVVVHGHLCPGVDRLDGALLGGAGVDEGAVDDLGRHRVVAAGEGGVAGGGEDVADGGCGVVECGGGVGVDHYDGGVAGTAENLVQKEVFPGRRGVEGLVGENADVRKGGAQWEENPKCGSSH